LIDGWLALVVAEAEAAAAAHSPALLLHSALQLSQPTPPALEAVRSSGLRASSSNSRPHALQQREVAGSRRG